MKRYLIIINNLPNNSLITEEILELILSIAALEANISVVFAGFAALLISENYSSTNQELLSVSLNALILFKLENIYISTDMLNKFKDLSINLNPDLEIKALERKELNNLYCNHDIIWYF